MSKKVKKANKTSQSVIKKNTRADGVEEYYITKAPQKTLCGKIMIWLLVGLMALGSVGALIVALIQLA